MKYYVRSNSYKASNVIIDSNRNAYSYDWWKFYDHKTGVFNYTRYSQSTSGHQRKVLNKLRELNIRPTLFLYNTGTNLTNVNEAIQDEINYYNRYKSDVSAKFNKLKNKTGTRGTNYIRDIIDISGKLVELTAAKMRLNYLNTEKEA